MHKIKPILTLISVVSVELFVDFILPFFFFGTVGAIIAVSFDDLTATFATAGYKYAVEVAIITSMSLMIAIAYVCIILRVTADRAIKTYQAFLRKEGSKIEQN